MLSIQAGLAGINQSYYCQTATERFSGPAAKKQTGLPDYTTPMETNPKNSSITKPQGTCNRSPHCMMKNYTAQKLRAQH